MLRHISLLAGVQLRNIFGLNEARYGKDKKKKNRLVLLACVFVFLGLVMMGYVTGLSYGLIRLGLAEIVPTYLFTVASLLVFFFTVFKSGDMIFNMKTYERVAVLPVRPSAIISSRLLSTYLFSLVPSLLVMLPGSAMYALFVGPSASFYVATLLGVLFLPLLPMTVAAAIGALILAVSSRMRHKNLVGILLSILFVLAILVLPVVSSFKASTGEINQEMLSSLSSLISSKINTLYPPSALFSAGVVGGDWASFLLFVAVSVVVFVLFVRLVEWKFVAICTALDASPARRNYVMRELQQRSRLKALYFKELRRYFASNIYVMNTSIGYIMMALFAAAVLIMGVEKIESMMEMKGILGKAIPIVLSFMCVISPTTTSAISLEGKQWWIVKSLPVGTKTVFDSKILVNLTVALPFYAAAEIMLCLALRMSLLEYLWMVFIPLLYILFTSVVDLAINAKMPMFDWESETVAVKQSGAVGLAILVGFLSVIVPFGILLALPETLRDLMFLAIAAALTMATAVLYRKNNRIELNRVE